MTGNDSMVVMLRNVTKSFAGRRALNGVNLDVPKGSVFALLGPNGAGKTTTIKIILNLLWLNSGSVEVLGMDGVAKSLEIRLRVGYQSEVQHFFHRAKVKDLIKLCSSLYPNWDGDRVARYIDAFDLHLGEQASDLSKGKKTLLGLVLAVGPNPDLLLLDEPFTGLDPLRRRQVLKLLAEEMFTEDRTILVSSHQIQDIERIADRTAFMMGGRIVLSRKVDDLLCEEKKIRVAFRGSTPMNIEKWPGVRRVEREGSRLLLSVSGHVKELEGRLSNHDVATFEVLDQTLEDIFVDYAQEEGLTND